MSTVAKYRWTLTIDRAKWLTGAVLKAVPSENATLSSVMSSSLHEKKTGLQCCLGFGCIKAGVSQAAISNVWLPSGVRTMSPFNEALMNALIVLEDDGEDETSRTVVSVNDDEDLPQAEREADLREHFAKYGIRLRFTGDHRAAIRTAQKVYGKRSKVTR